VQWAVREGPWKLIGAKDQARWLGNLDDDAPEAVDYLKEKPDLAARLHALHDAWAIEVTADLKEQDAP